MNAAMIAITAAAIITPSPALVVASPVCEPVSCGFAVSFVSMVISRAAIVSTLKLVARGEGAVAATSAIPFFWGAGVMVTMPLVLSSCLTVPFATGVGVAVALAVAGVGVAVAVVAVHAQSPLQLAQDSPASQYPSPQYVAVGLHAPCTQWLEEHCQSAVQLLHVAASNALVACCGVPLAGHAWLNDTAGGARE